MSGRLILLPKKSYTPWNAQTVERVLRDERLEAQRLEKERSDDARSAGLERIRKLKGATTSNDDDGDDGAAKRKATDGEEAAPRHVNLFQAEETEMLQRTLRGCATDTDNNADVDGRKRRREEVGILPVFLDGRTSSQNGYRTRDRSVSTSRFQVDSKFSEISAEERRKDERRKLSLDPANAFAPTNATVEGIDDKSLAVAACPDSGDTDRNPVHVEKLNHASNDNHIHDDRTGIDSFSERTRDVNRRKQRSDKKQKRSSMDLSSSRHRRRRCSLDANRGEEETTALASSSRSDEDSASDYASTHDSHRSRNSRKRRRKTSKRHRRDCHGRTKRRTTRDRDDSSDDETDGSRCSVSGRDRKRRRKSSKDGQKYRRRKNKSESNDYRDKRSSFNRKSDTSAATATSPPASSLEKQSTASALQEMKQRQLLREREETRREMLLHIQAAEARQY